MGSDNAGTGLMLEGVTDGDVTGGGVVVAVVVAVGVAVVVAVGVEATASHLQELGLQVCPGAQKLGRQTGPAQPPVPSLHMQVLPLAMQVPNSPQLPAQSPQKVPGVFVGVGLGAPGTSHMQVVGLHDVCGAVQAPKLTQVGAPQLPPMSQTHVLPDRTHTPIKFVPQGLGAHTPQNWAPAVPAPTCRSQTNPSVA